MISLWKSTSISSAKLLSWKSEVLVPFATTSLMMPRNSCCFSRTLTHWLLQLSLGWSPSGHGRQTSDSPKLCSPSCSPCTSTCSRHSNTHTSSLVARQSPNFLEDCMPLFQRHYLLHPCLSLWPSTSVLACSISLLQCRRPPPQNSILQVQNKRCSCFLLLWSFCLELKSLPLHTRNATAIYIFKFTLKIYLFNLQESD